VLLLLLLLLLLLRPLLLQWSTSGDVSISLVANVFVLFCFWCFFFFWVFFAALRCVTML